MTLTEIASKVEEMIDERCRAIVDQGELTPSQIALKDVIDGDEFLTANKGIVSHALKDWKQNNKAKGGGSIALWKQDSERLHEIIKTLADYFQANDRPEMSPFDWESLCQDLYSIATGLYEE